MQRKISFEQAEEMRKVWKEAEDQYGLLSQFRREYNISITIIKKILRNQSHLTPEEPHTALTEDDIRNIRLLGAMGLYTYKAIGEEFKITGWCASQIVRRETWKHVQ